MRNIVGLLVFLGTLGSYYYGSPATKAKAKENLREASQQIGKDYIKKYGGPVSGNMIEAFMEGRSLNPNASPTGVFVTKHAVILYDPDADMDRRELYIALEDITDFRIGAAGMRIQSRDGSFINLQPDNLIYSKFLRETIDELRSPGDRKAVPMTRPIQQPFSQAY